MMMLVLVMRTTWPQSSHCFWPRARLRWRGEQREEGEGHQKEAPWWSSSWSRYHMDGECGNESDLWVMKSLTSQGKVQKVQTLGWKAILRKSGIENQNLDLGWFTYCAPLHTCQGQLVQVDIFGVLQIVFPVNISSSSSVSQCHHPCHHHQCHQCHHAHCALASLSSSSSWIWF